MTSRRTLHFVFKVGNRKKDAHFYRNVLGMKFLRHEEFEEGCKASCNGPYDGHWSKSMVGYGPEDTHFVMELTYNYGIGSYKLGDDFQGITIHSKDVLARVKQLGWPLKEKDGQQFIQAPDGYKFFISEGEISGDPVKKATLSCSNLQKSVDYWHGKLGMQIFEQTSKSCIMGYSDSQAKIELVDIGRLVDHGTAFGRVAIACPGQQLPELQKTMKESGERILTELVSLATPGKATVQVIILADPDGHEICFVGDEGFRQLSQVDPRAESLLDEAMAADKSEEWFTKKGLTKSAA